MFECDVTASPAKAPAQRQARPRESTKAHTAMKWRALGDDFRTFLGEFVAALPQIDFPAGLTL